MHILLVEDDKRISGNIKKMLEKANFLVTAADSGQDALFDAETQSYDVIILDWMLPDISGIEICTKLREAEVATPILMLTAKSQLEDKVEGFSQGVDDYLTKPFEMEELLMRVKALVRRKESGIKTTILKIADLTIDTNICKVKRADKEIKLAPKEYALLEYLMLNQGQTVDRMALLHHVWGEDIDLLTNTVDVHIRYLRAKIDEGHSQKLIKTIKNKGYLICLD